MSHPDPTQTYAGEDPVEVCNQCGEPVRTVGNDALSFCEEHGIVGGNTHFEPEVEVV